LYLVRNPGLSLGLQDIGTNRRGSEDQQFDSEGLTAILYSFHDFMFFNFKLVMV